MVRQVYDSSRDCLVMLMARATPEFWDGHWSPRLLKEKIIAGTKDRFVARHTKRFLKPRSRILEGGCGIGQNVFVLSRLGYDVHGVDFAAQTVEKVKKEFPSLNISAQDVRGLAYPDGFFDGYWSFGVIEHFAEGYSKILQEAHRVLKPGGVLFLTFPCICPVRRLKIRLGMYEQLPKPELPDDFYQFILDPGSVIKNVEYSGFRIVMRLPFDATKGLKQEIRFLSAPMRYCYRHHDILSRSMRFINSLLFSRLAGHNILLVFKKVES